MFWRWWQYEQAKEDARVATNKLHVQLEKVQREQEQEREQLDLLSSRDAGYSERKSGASVAERVVRMRSAAARMRRRLVWRATCQRK